MLLKTPIFKIRLNILSQGAVFIWVALLSSLSLNAEEFITVTVSGYGNTPEAAERNALQKAVRKAVGEIVDAETIAKNGQLIKDKVLSYSDGFVQSKKTLSGPEKDEDLGLFAVVIEAKVLPKKLATKLEEAEITTSAVAGEDIWAQAVSKISNVFEGRDMLAKLVKEEIVPAKLLKARLISKGPDGHPLYGDEAQIQQKIDYDEKTVEMTYMIEVSWDREAYLNRVVPKLTSLLEKIAVAPPVEVKGPLFKTGVANYPNGELCYAAKDNFLSQLTTLNQSVGVDSKKGPGPDGKYDCAFPGNYGEKFRAVWSEDHFFAVVDVSTETEEFAVKVFTLKGDEYYKVFFKNLDIHDWEWDYGKSEFVPGSRYPDTRIRRFPDLIFEVLDEDGNTLASKLLSSDDMRPVYKINSLSESSVLSSLKNDETKKILLHWDAKSNSMYNSSFSKMGNLKWNLPHHHKRDRSGFFDPIGVRNNGVIGCAHLTMPKFFFSGNNAGMSNTTLFGTELTIPYETTKRISSIRLYWQDDSWMNTNPQKGSLKPDNDTHSPYSFESLTSGRTGLVLEYSDDDLKIKEVPPKSPAAESGRITPGDTLSAFAYPNDLLRTNQEGPLHWNAFSKLDASNVRETWNAYLNYHGYSLRWRNSKIPPPLSTNLNRKDLPLKAIVELLLCGPPETYVYLLIKPEANPKERIIVPVLRKALTF